MISFLKYTAVFGVGVWCGVQLAKRYAKTEVHSGVHDLLSKVGLGGGDVEAAINKVIDSKVFEAS